MIYLNPFELLQTFAGDGDEWCDFDEKSLRRARRRLIAEADLEGTLQVKENDLSKNEIAAILDELDDDDKFENHRTVYENKPLLSFLSDGNPSIFEKADETDIYDLYCADFDLIAKPFAAQFNKLFAEAFEESDAWQIKQMSRFLRFIDDKQLHNCFKSVEKFLAALIEKYENLLSEVKNENFDADEVENILDEIYEDIDSETLNSLPGYFELNRDRIATAIEQIAVNLYNKYDEREIAFDISEIADDINAEALTKNRIKRNKGIFKDGLAQIEFAKQLKKIERVAAIAEELKKFTKDLNSHLASGTIHNKLGNRLFIKTLKKQIQDVLDFNEINSLSDEVEVTKDLRDSIALELKKLSVVSYNHINDLDFSLLLVEMALQINVTPTTYSLLLKSKNHLINKKTTAQYPLFDRQFAVEIINPEAEKPKANFGQNNDSVNTNSADGNSSYGQTRRKTYNKKYETTPSFNYVSSENKSEFQQILVKVIGAVVIFFAAIIIYFNFSSDDKFSNINAELKKMNAGSGFSVPAKSSEKLSRTKFKKKLLPINAQTKMVDAVFYDQMPSAIKSDSLDNVNTFIWINCHVSSKSIYYPTASTRSTMVCDLVAVDKYQTSVIGRKTFEEEQINDKVTPPKIPYIRIINYLIENTER